MASSPARYKACIRSFSLFIEDLGGLVPFPLQNFQEGWIDIVFNREWNEEKQRWQRPVREAVIGVGRKNAKTETIAAIALANMILDAPQHGLIVLAAAKRDQAALLLAAAKRLVWNSKIQGQPLSKFIKVRRDHLYFPERDVTLKTIAADAQKEHGLNPHLFIVDEGHATLETSRELYDTLLTAQGARQDPLAIIITTAGPAPRGPMHDLYVYGKEIQRGSREPDPNFAFIWHEAEPDAKIDDLNAWRDANPAFDVFPNFRENAEKTIKAVLAGRMPEFMARRLHLNQWTYAAERWLPYTKVEACGGTPEIPEGARVTIGIDAAVRKDTFAVVMVYSESREGQPPLAHVKCKRFVPGYEGGYIDPDEVVTYILGLAARYNVDKVVFDPAYMQLVRNQLGERGLTMEEFPQSASRMTRATEVFWQRFTQELVRHGNDPFLLDHIAALAIKPTESGARMSKLKAMMPTDLAVALAMALDSLYGDEPEGDAFAFLV